MDDGGAGTPKDPRKRDRDTGLWWEELATMAAGRRGRRYVAWAFDPRPRREVTAGIRGLLEQAKFSGFSRKPPAEIRFEADARYEEIDPARLLDDGAFAERAGLGQGLLAADRLLGAAAVDLGPRKLSRLLLRFDHSNLEERKAAVLHVVQWSEQGDPEGGMTIVALAPRGR